MFDCRHHFRWHAEDESSWLEHLESLRLTPSAHDLRARGVTPHVKRSHSASTSASRPQDRATLMARGPQAPLDPLGHDD